MMGPTIVNRTSLGLGISIKLDKLYQSNKFSYIWRTGFVGQGICIVIHLIK